MRFLMDNGGGLLQPEGIAVDSSFLLTFGGR